MEFKSKIGGILFFSILTAIIFSLPALAYEPEVYTCVDITPITEFHDGDTSETLVIEGGMSDTSSKILVPMDLEVEGAYVDITGQSITNESAMDMVILSDISASMNESVENMKSDTKDIIDIVLAQTYNKAGLVSFRTTVVDVKPLTDNKQELFDVVDTYVPEGSTCIACAIKKGIELIEERGTPQRVMLLLTNGEANICTYGLCYNPKEQAVEMAAYAWNEYGIKIYAVPYEDDSDLETLQNITDAANGKLYGIGTNMSDVYDDMISNGVDAQTVSVSCDPSSGVTDDVIQVNVSIDGNTEEVSAFGFDFIYDTNVFQYESVSKGTLTAEWFAVDGNEITPGTITVGGFAGFVSIPPGSSGSLAVINLRVTCNGCANCQDSQPCVDNYLDGIAGLTPEPSCTTFTFSDGTPCNYINESFSGYPSDVVLDVGDDGTEEFSHSGEFLGTENVDFTTELTELLACECEGCEVSGDDCLIDMKVSSSETGVVILDNLMITGCLNMTTECTPGETRLCFNQEGVCEDSYETCPSGGFWEGCDYSYIEGYEDPEETCDFLDNDCDGETDEGVENTYYFDSDNDGYGNAGNTIQACYPPEGYVSTNNDCDDNDATIHPGAGEVCGDGKDNNCDGSVDEGCGGGGGSRRGGGGPSYYCGDGFVTGDEECEADEDCPLFYNCEECACVLGCAEDWTCGEWSECSQEGVQTKTCIDNNDCGTSEIKPSESQSCEYTVGEEAEVTPLTEVCGNGVCEENEDCEDCPEDCGACSDGLTGMFTGLQAGAIAGLIALLVILLLLFFSMRNKKK